MKGRNFSLKPTKRTLISALTAFFMAVGVAVFAPMPTWAALYEFV